VIEISRGGPAAYTSIRESSFSVSVTPNKKSFQDSTSTMEGMLY
jgi:hypothetical protein